MLVQLNLNYNSCKQNCHFNQYFEMPQYDLHLKANIILLLLSLLLLLLLLLLDLLSSTNDNLFTVGDLKLRCGQHVNLCNGKLFAHLASKRQY